MNKKLLISTLTLGIVLSVNFTSLTSAQANTDINSASSIKYNLACNEELKLQEAIEFFQEFQTAVKNNNKDKVADMFIYPKAVSVNNTEAKYINSAKEFLPYYDKIFTSDFKRHLAKISANELHLESSFYTTNDKRIWLTKTNDIINIASVFQNTERNTYIAYYEGSDTAIKNTVISKKFDGNTIDINMPVIMNSDFKEAQSFFSTNIANSMYAYMPHTSNEYGAVTKIPLKKQYSFDEIKDIAKTADFIHTRHNKKALENGEFSNRYAMDANYELKLNNEKYLSILQSIYTYTGGAHGMTVRYSMTTDKQTGKTVKLKDLFSSNEYIDYLNKLAANQNKDIHFYNPVTLSGTEDFYLTPDGLVLYYQLYEVAPYAAGFIEYNFSYDDLAPILK